MLEISRRAFRHKPLCERKGVRVRFHACGKGQREKCFRIFRAFREFGFCQGARFCHQLR